MNFYRINNSLDSKVVGAYPQVVEAIYHCHVWDEPNFVDRVNFIETNFEPITANAVLEKNAIPTDLISAGIIGFSLKLLMSGKLKELISLSEKKGLQFYKSPIIYNDIPLDDYWVMNPYLFDEKLIDFAESKICLKKGRKKLEQLDLKNFEQFKSKKEEIEKLGNPYRIFIERFEFQKDTTVDFLILRNVEGGIGNFVSEKLKFEIEESGCTGIEFMPQHYSLNEWLSSNGPRQKIYGKV